MAQYLGFYDATSGSPNYNSEAFARRWGNSWV